MKTKKKMPAPKDDGHKWQKMDRNLVAGDILRIRVENAALPEYGQYAYGVCSGSGFGCSMNTIGAAIYVNWVGYDVEEVIGHRDEEPTLGEGGTYPVRSERWERYWGIEYLAE
jgi:hypothetical protein